MISNQNHQDLGQTRRFYQYLGLKCVLYQWISMDFSWDLLSEKLKMLYLRDYSELVGQPVHRSISV